MDAPDMTDGTPTVIRRLSVLVPVFNEREPLPELRRRLQTAVPDATLVFVDNGSTDGTVALIESWCADDPRIRLVRHATNLGYGRSLLDGFAASDGSHVVMIDADRPRRTPEVRRGRSALPWSRPTRRARRHGRRRPAWAGRRGRNSSRERPPSGSPCCPRNEPGETGAVPGRRSTRPIF